MSLLPKEKKEIADSILSTGFNIYGEYLGSAVEGVARIVEVGRGIDGDEPQLNINTDFVPINMRSDYKKGLMRSVNTSQKPI